MRPSNEKISWSRNNLGKLLKINKINKLLKVSRKVLIRSISVPIPETGNYRLLHMRRVKRVSSTNPIFLYACVLESRLILCYREAAWKHGARFGSIPYRQGWRPRTRPRNPKEEV